MEEDLPSSPRELTYDARDVGGPSSGRQDYREMRDLRCDYRDPPHRDYHEYRDSRDQRDPRDARDMRDTYRERNEWDSEDRGPPARHHSRDSDYASPHRAPSRRPRNAMYDDRRWTPSSVDQANYFLKELEKPQKNVKGKKKILKILPKMEQNYSWRERKDFKSERVKPMKPKNLDKANETIGSWVNPKQVCVCGRVFCFWKMPRQK